MQDLQGLVFKEKTLLRLLRLIFRFKEVIVRKVVEPREGPKVKGKSTLRICLLLKGFQGGGKA